MRKNNIFFSRFEGMRGEKTTNILHLRSGNEDAENSVCEPQTETNPRQSDPKSIIPFGKSAISGHENEFFKAHLLANSKQ